MLIDTLPSRPSEVEHLPGLHHSAWTAGHVERRSPRRLERGGEGPFPRNPSQAVRLDGLTIGRRSVPRSGSPSFVAGRDGSGSICDAVLHVAGPT